MVRAVGEESWRRLRAHAEPFSSAMLEALSPLLVLAPHPDDETLGCGGLLASAAALGLNPQVAFLTDGSASHKGSAAWPPRRLAERRRAEAKDALAALGVSSDQALFLDWPDSRPADPSGVVYQDALGRLSTLVQAAGVKSLFAPRLGERHCDHEAASRLGRSLAERSRLRLFDYMVWGWEDPALACLGAGERAWSLACASSVDRRRRALDCHQTQTSDLISDAREAFLIPPALAALTSREAEIFLERP